MLFLSQVYFLLFDFYVNFIHFDLILLKESSYF